MGRAALPTLLLLATPLFVGAARAEPRSLPLDPAHAEVGFRAYKLGLIPLDGSFTRFSGVLVIDPRLPQTCHIHLSVEVASLHTADPADRDDVLAPDMLDAAAFPTLGFTGVCAGDGIEGPLTMHGITKPLHLAIVNPAPHYVVETALRRRDWGVSGRPLTAGATVRIRVSTTVPP